MMFVFTLAIDKLISHAKSAQINLELSWLPTSAVLFVAPLSALLLSTFPPASIFQFSLSFSVCLFPSFLYLFFPTNNNFIVALTFKISLSTFGKILK